MLSLTIFCGATFFPLSAQAQPQLAISDLVVRPDAILMIENTQDGEVGFVLPRVAAVYFRNQHHLVRSMDARMGTLEAMRDSLFALVDNKDGQLAQKDGIIGDMQRKIVSFEGDLNSTRALLDETNAARKRERRWKLIWRTTTIAFAGSTVVLGLLAAAN